MKKNLTVIIFILAIIGIILFLFFRRNNISQESNNQSDMIPSHQNSSQSDENEGWKEYTMDSEYTFRYPESLDTQFISTSDWPPQVQLLDTLYACTDAGEVIDRAGKTEERRINGMTYCVTEIDEGAAGSIYHQYAYVFSKQDQTVVMNFSLRFVQCLNYDEPEQSTCEKEQTDFDVDHLLDAIARTLVLSS